MGFFERLCVALSCVYFRSTQFGGAPETFIQRPDFSRAAGSTTSHVLWKIRCAPGCASLTFTYYQRTSKQGCVFPHPEPIFFRATAFFNLSNIFPLFHSRGKGVIWGRDRNMLSPDSLCTTLSTSTRFVQAFGLSFSVIFTPHSSFSRLYRIVELF